MESIIKSCKNLKLKPLSATLFLVLSLITSSGLLFFSPYQANAAIGDADNLIRPTNELKLYGTSCSIDVGYAGLVTDLIMNDQLWSQDQGMHGFNDTQREQIQSIWENRTSSQVVQKISNWTNSDTPDLTYAYIQVAFTDGVGAYNKINDNLPWWNGYPQPNMVSKLPNGGNIVFLTFQTNSDCTSLDLTYGAFTTTGTNGDGFQILFSNANTFGRAPLLFATTGATEYPAGYQGSDVPTEPSNKYAIYPTLGISIENKGQDRNKITMTMDTDFMEKFRLPSPDYIILTLTDYDTQEIIEADTFQGPYPVYDNVSNGTYTVHLVVVYTDENITDVYEFKDTFYNINVDGTSYSIFYNSNEGKYCSVRNGYEWNCQIPQPEEESNEVVTGDPEEWTAETCDLANLGGCVRNILHWLGEYLGLNGPSITAGSSPFFQFDTNTFGLTAILTAPLGILNSLQNAQYFCTTPQLPLPFIGGNMSLPCLQPFYDTTMGELYDVYTTIINGIIAYYVILGLLAMVKDAKDPQKDKIEAVKL